MHLIDWLIVLIPLAGVLYLAIRCGRYVRGVADFLAAGRVAGRYVISVGDLQSMLSVITLIALCEQEQDFVSREMLEDMLEHCEEAIDWLETQHSLIDDITLPNYLQSQIGDQGD